MLKTTADFVRGFVAGKYEKPHDVLLDLSDRFVSAAKDLGLPHVPLLFAMEHGRISSDHYRTLAHVFEVIICDLEDADEVKKAVHDVVTWYWASRASEFSNAAIDALRVLGRTMLASLQVFDTPEFRAILRADADVPVGPVETIPKIHRAVEHMADWIMDFGPYDDLTTEASETANKPLKQMFKTYVSFACCELMMCVCVCDFTTWESSNIRCPSRSRAFPCVCARA